jgi:hypothetical protein
MIARALHRFIGGVAIMGLVLQVFGHGERLREAEDIFLADRKKSTVLHSDSCNKAALFY